MPEPRRPMPDPCHRFLGPITPGRRLHAAGDFRETVRGFTLIEMLVVISVIVLLITILLPALGRSRDAARAVKCRSNLKQMHTGWIMALENTGGRIPITTDYLDSRSWAAALFKIYPNAPKMTMSNIESFNACPAVQSRYSGVTYFPQSGRWGYAINSWWSNAGPEFNENKAWDSIGRPSQYPWFSDPLIYPFGISGKAGSWRLPDTARGAPNWGVGANHAEESVVNVIFADGGSRGVPLVEIHEGMPAENQFVWLEHN